MVRLAAVTPSPSRQDTRTDATSASFAGSIDVNGICLPYVEQGSGESVVFVHGALSDLRAWEPMREQLAQRPEIANGYRFIAYTQRYYGIHSWTDDGEQFSVATHADDLTKLIAALDAGPVHLAGLSYGGLVAATAAVKNPALVRSLVLYEPAFVSVLPEDSEDARWRATTVPNSLVRCCPRSVLAMTSVQPG
jgi:pimeloyl-ACP methyl ester carboxylesterase